MHAKALRFVVAGFLLMNILLGSALVLLSSGESCSGTSATTSTCRPAFMEEALLLAGLGIGLGPVFVSIGLAKGSATSSPHR